MQKLPKAFNTKILSRFMKERDMQEFLELYRSNCMKVRNRNVGEPSQRDLRVMGVLRETKSYKETAEKLGISVYQVLGAASRVGVYSA